MQRHKHQYTKLRNFVLLLTIATMTLFTFFMVYPESCTQYFNIHFWFTEKDALILNNLFALDSYPDEFACEKVNYMQTRLAQGGEARGLYEISTSEKFIKEVISNIPHARLTRQNDHWKLEAQFNGKELSSEEKGRIQTTASSAYKVIEKEWGPYTDRAIEAYVIFTKYTAFGNEEYLESFVFLFPTADKLPHRTKISIYVSPMMEYVKTGFPPPGDL